MRSQKASYARARIIAGARRGRAARGLASAHPRRRRRVSRHGGSARTSAGDHATDRLDEHAGAGRAGRGSTEGTDTAGYTSDAEAGRVGGRR